MAERKKASLWLLIPIWTLTTLLVLWSAVFVYAATWDLWAKPSHSPSPVQAKQVEPREHR
jgi:hypothetical protein